MAFSFSSTQKKSFILSVIIYTVLLLLLFFVRFWPPSTPIIQSTNGGSVSVNFGNSDFGSGTDYKNDNLNTPSEPINPPSEDVSNKELISQENEDEESVFINKNNVKDKKTVPEKKANEPIIKKQKINNTTNEALANILKATASDGDDNVGGNKGKTNGNLNTTNYYGDGGSGNGNGKSNGSGNGNGEGYLLGNRKAISKPNPKYTCNEEGKVVVEIIVDRNGKTIQATAGIKGTTNTAACLLYNAKIAAMNTLWNPIDNAPERQVGKIIYNFTLN